ncbi:MAG: electron transfer flavoprotein subunit alpha/FixB family protein [Burkholderiales bacterium]|nr:electron transfer flavoprotein subunit alpha/FixB family protein [Burkholderiales bacterium]
MKVLVITFAKEQKLNDNLLNVLSAAKRINRHCDVLILGNADYSRVQELKIVEKIMLFNNVTDATNSATLLASNLAEIVKNYTHTLIAADSYGKDLLPRIAGILDLSQISEVVEIVSPNTFKKPMYAGNILAEVESFEEIKLLTIRTTSFAAYSEAGSAASVEVNEFSPLANDKLSYLGEELVHNDTIDLAHAELIVTGGRSLGSKEDFDKLIHGLAIKLGGAVGASRAAVEAGYASNDCQVGQTGKVVAPKLYVAIGISGAVQHIAGMKDSKTVVAVNLDPNAQIFEYADYGLIGDLFDVVPELISKL